MDQNRSSSKITEIVGLHQMLKKWRKLAAAPPKSGGKKTAGFIKRTLSFSSEISSSHSPDIPKGFLAVAVGEEVKRFVIPTEYLGRRDFTVLLREAEEEFGFHQEGVLRIPCRVSVFERILKAAERDEEGMCCRSPPAELTQPYNLQVIHVYNNNTQAFIPP